MHERRTKGKYFRMWSMHMTYWHRSFFSHVFAEGRAHFESELFVWLPAHALRNHSRPLLRMTAARSQKRELRGRKFLFQTSLRSIVFRENVEKK